MLYGKMRFNAKKSEANKGEGSAAPSAPPLNLPLIPDKCYNLLIAAPNRFIICQLAIVIEKKS